MTERMQARGFERDINRTGDVDQCEANVDRTDIDRSRPLRLYPLMRSLPGRIAVHAAFAFQGMTILLPRGNGYLVKAARKR